MLSFSKINHLDGNPYRVFSDDEVQTGTATVHCRESNGDLMKPDEITVLCDDDFAANEQEVREEYARLLNENKID